MPDLVATGLCLLAGLAVLVLIPTIKFALRGARSDRGPIQAHPAIALVILSATAVVSLAVARGLRSRQPWSLWAACGLALFGLVLQGVAIAAIASSHEQTDSGAYAGMGLVVWAGVLVAALVGLALPSTRRQFRST